jgi:hypothetical protein
MTRVFAAGSQEAKDGIASLIAQMESLGFSYCTDDMGAYAPFLPGEELAGVYPVHYYEQGDIATYLAAVSPYTTQEAVYAEPAAG